MEVLILIPMPMVRWRQIILVLWNLLQSCRVVRGLYFQHTCTLLWRSDPTGRADTIVLLESIQAGSVSSLYVERHFELMDRMKDSDERV